MNKVAGTQFNLPAEVKKDIPLQHRLAAMELSNQFYKIVADGWHHDRLHVRVFRDKETINPTTYNILQLPNGVMVREEDTGRRSQWNIYSKDPKPEPQRSPTRAFRRPRHETAPVVEDKHSENIHSLFVHRADVKDDLHALELLFIKDPQPDVVLKMNKLRTEMGKLEQKIVLYSLAERMLPT